MRAIRVHQFGGPDVLQFEDVPDPYPGPGQVVVRAHAVGVNPVETYIRAGTYPVTPPLPFTPGNDAAGVVETVGEGITDLKAGDRVYAAGSLSGTYAEKILCTRSSVYPLPEGITFQQGAALGVPYGTAYRALFQRGHARAGEIVLIHGATGGVGTAAVQLARAAGLTVIGTGGSDAGRKLVSEQGAHHVLDHHSSDIQERIRALTGGRGVDLVVEMLANVNLAKDLGLLATHGRVVVVGSRGSIEIDPRQTMGSERTIIGMTLNLASEQEKVEIHSALRAGLENRTLRPVIGQEFPLEEAARAHEAVMAGNSFGKIVLVVP